MKHWSDREKERNKNKSPNSKFVWRVQTNTKNRLQLKEFQQGRK